MCAVLEVWVCVFNKKWYCSGMRDIGGLQGSPYEQSFWLLNGDVSPDQVHPPEGGLRSLREVRAALWHVVLARMDGCKQKSPNDTESLPGVNDYLTELFLALDFHDEARQEKVWVERLLEATASAHQHANQLSPDEMCGAATISSLKERTPEALEQSRQAVGASLLLMLADPPHCEFDIF
jgi:hypothetical protein